jgi:hypothetical protein
VDLEPRYALEGSLALWPGPARDSPASPRALHLAAWDVAYLLGALAVMRARPDCVGVAYAPEAAGGLHAGLARFVQEQTAAELCLSLKEGGTRARLMPCLQDEAFVQRFRTEPPEDAWLLGPPRELGPPDATGGYLRWRGPSSEASAVGSVPKLCLATTDGQALCDVLARLREQPTCVMVKHNARAWSGGVWLGRAVMRDPEETGRLWWALSERRPDLHPRVQDDGWLQPLRRP